MSEDTELKEDLRRLLEERRRALGPHPNDDELSLFVSGALPTTTQETIRQHVAHCLDCSDRLRAAFDDLAIFESDQPMDGEPESFSDPDAIAARGRQLATEFAPAGPSVPRHWYLALAAALVAGLVVGVLVDELLETDRAPEGVSVGAPIESLAAPGSTTRSMGDAVKRVVLQPEDRNVTLVLPPPRFDDGPFPGDRLRIEGIEGSWPVDESQLEDYGLGVQISREFVPPGAYRLILETEDGTPVAAYDLEIITPEKP